MNRLESRSDARSEISRADMAKAIRALSKDAVEKAKSGHPGPPMGMALAERMMNARFGDDRVDHYTYVSTAAGAFLEWLEGKELPGVAALRSEAAALEEV